MVMQSEILVQNHNFYSWQLIRLRDYLSSNILQKGNDLFDQPFIIGF